MTSYRDRLKQIGGIATLGALLLIPTCSHGREEKLESKTGRIHRRAIAEYIAANEGIKLRVYDPVPNDGKYEPTIGVGHYMGRPDSKKVFNKVLPEIDYGRVLSGKQDLTEEQALRLFQYDLGTYIDRARAKISNYDGFPLGVKKAIVDGFYRGDLSRSPRTLRYINKGKFDKAAIEYLNHNEYRNAKRLGKPGVAIRMKKNSEAFERYYRERRGRR